jgi:hypothetical protein
MLAVRWSSKENIIQGVWMLYICNKKWGLTCAGMFTMIVSKFQLVEILVPIRLEVTNIWSIISSSVPMVRSD